MNENTRIKKLNVYSELINFHQGYISDSYSLNKRDSNICHRSLLENKHIERLKNSIGSSSDSEWRVLDVRSLDDLMNDPEFAHIFNELGFE